MHLDSWVIVPKMAGYDGIRRAETKKGQKA